jgi:hypothetical protein
MLACGDTFLTGNDDEEDEDWHLWIVTSPPVAGEVVVTCVTTRRKHSEPLVILKPGDHPFIKNESVIAYAFTKIRTVADIEAAIQQKSAKKRECVSEAVLKRVQDGVFDSDFTPNGERRYFKSVMEDNKDQK